MDYRLDRISKFNDQRGQLVVFLKNHELAKSYKEFGQIYFVTFDGKGVIRGNHYHKRWREWFGVVNGRLEVLLQDLASSELVKLELNGDLDDYVRLEIGPDIVHAFRSLTTTASLLNYTDKEWSSDDTFPLTIMQDDV